MRYIHKYVHVIYLSIVIYIYIKSPKKMQSTSSEVSHAHALLAENVSGQDTTLEMKKNCRYGVVGAGRVEKLLVECQDVALQRDSRMPLLLPRHILSFELQGFRASSLWNPTENPTVNKAQANQGRLDGRPERRWQDYADEGDCRPPHRRHAAGPVM